MLRSLHNRAKRAVDKQRLQQKRSEAQYGTKAYRDALQRAFNKAKEQIYFNPDMQYFVTLTYRGIERDLNDVMQDVKVWLKHERRYTDEDIKYLWVAEYQERGSIHIHMITNAPFKMRKNKNNYDEIEYWAEKHGFTSVLHINDLDNNFKPYLYLFKYMRKAQRIGKSFVHTSRNLGNYFQAEEHHLNLLQWNTINQEYTSTYINNTQKLVYIRNFLCYDDNG